MILCEGLPQSQLIHIADSISGKIRMTNNVLAGSPNCNDIWMKKITLKEIFFSRLKFVTPAEISYINSQQDLLHSCGQIHQKLDQNKDTRYEQWLSQVEESCPLGGKLNLILRIGTSCHRTVIRSGLPCKNHHKIP